MHLCLDMQGELDECNRFLDFLWVYDEATAVQRTLLNYNNSPPFMKENSYFRSLFIQQGRSGLAGYRGLPSTSAATSTSKLHESRH